MIIKLVLICVGGWRLQLKSNYGFMFISFIIQHIDSHMRVVLIVKCLTSRSFFSEVTCWSLFKTCAAPAPAPKAEQTPVKDQTTQATQTLLIFVRESVFVCLKKRRCSCFSGRIANCSCCSWRWPWRPWNSSWNLRCTVSVSGRLKLEQLSKISLYVFIVHFQTYLWKKSEDQ
jgi:hypothetical protein